MYHYMKKLYGFQISLWFLPCPGGSVGWSIVLYTRRLGVWFPVRAHTEVAGSVPSWGMCGRQPINVSLSRWCFSLSLSLSLFLKSINILKKIFWTKIFQFDFFSNFSLSFFLSMYTAASWRKVIVTSLNLCWFQHLDHLRVGICWLYCTSRF